MADPQVNDLSDTLADAALFGNKVLLESLLENGADPNIPNSKGSYPLHEAAQYGETECASLLLAHKAGVNAIGRKGKTPLHFAVSGVLKQEPGEKHASEEVIHQNQMNIVRLLVSHGADLNAVDNEGCTPRDLAMDCDFYECADLIDELEKLKAKHTEDMLREERLKELFLSCEEGNLAMVKKLLPHVRSALNEFLGNKKDNLLMCAAEHGHLPIVEYCLAEGAVAVANLTTNKTALHLACENGHTDVVVALLNHLPALLMIDDSPGETSLHIVARAGHPEIARNLLLVARQTEILKNTNRACGEETPTPGYLYDRNNTRHEMNEALPEIELDVMAKSIVRENRTALHEAAIHGNVELVRLLVDFLRTYSDSPRLSRGARRGGNSSPALHRASVVGGRPGPSSPTSAYQTNLDGPGFSRESAAAKQQSEPVPGIDAFTLKGRTAFHEASRHQHYEVMDILLQAGADINAFMSMDLDPNAQTDLTALVQACLMDQPETVRFLLRHGAKDARLKALSRSLKAKLNYIAGILLCYNKQVREVAPDIARALSLSSEGSMTFFQVMWNSKNLKFIHEDWLELVTHELPQPQDRLCAIAQLDISSNQLTELPLEIFKLPYLTTLDFSRNEISVFPCEEGRHNGGWSCCKLSVVEGTRNQLLALPPSLFYLPELKEINVCSNKIASVPASVWTAPKLSKIYLAGNLLDMFPTVRRSQGSLDESTFEGPFSPASPGNSAVLDSGYRSEGHNLSQMVDSMSLDMGSGKAVMGGSGGGVLDRAKERRPSLFQLAYRPSNLQATEHTVHTIQTQAVISRRLESFQDATMEEEELEELGETESVEDKGSAFLLEVLDLSNNKLTAIPANLCCLAPKLTKLNVAKNSIKSLGHINDYPLDLEFLDASYNNIHAAIAPAVSIADLRYHQSCARKHVATSPAHTASLTSVTEGSVAAVVGTPTTPPYFPKLCSHRTHKNLRKLSTLKLSHNHLIDVPLFRTVSKNPRTDLSASMEESSKLRVGTSDPHALMVASSRLPEQQQTRVQESFSKSINFISRAAALTSSKKTDIPLTQQEAAGKGSGSSNSESSSQEGSGHRASGGGGGGEGPTSPSTTVVISPLYPMLATLELSYNQLRNVPSKIHRISSLSSLLLNHNKDIDHLPLELSNLEHLWNLEYEGCPLTNPPKEDLDKYRLASDKLQYMRSLLHDAKPNESMKLMLVGYQRMGKTTLLSRLREVHEKVTPFTTFTQRVTGEEPARPKKGRADTLSTVGVDLGIWKYRKDLEGDLKGKRKGGKSMRSVTFYTWDFGGQEEYYVTHQCFLSTRSLYLVVWNVTKGEKGIENLGPWLHNIQARAPASPVVIVGTHCDTLKPDTEKEKRKAELNHIIYQKYLVGHGPQQLRELGLPKILDVIYVGCPLNGRPEGVAELRCALYNIAFSLSASAKVGAKTKLLEQPIPASYLKLEERVRHLAVSYKERSLPPLLKEQDFIEKTKDIIANPRELNQAVTFLHENGIMLHYATPALSHLYFVDPQWLCDMLAHIVTVPEVNRFIPRKDSPEAGILRTTVLSHVFKGNIFPQAHRKEYIELLGKFEVALYLDRHRLLVPSMLPNKPSFTIHRFKNVFPRPCLSSIIHHSPETPRLFGRSDTHSQNGECNATPSKDDKDLSQSNRLSTAPVTTPTTLAVATHTSEEFYRTGLILRRFYFMTYVPSGFWPRLISRFLASSEFVAIVQRNLGYTKEQVREMAEQLASGECKGTTDLEWSYWKTGIELWYKGLSLLRLTEILPEGSFEGCKPSSSIFAQSETSPVEPYVDVSDLTFELTGGWIPVEMNPGRGIEILVPDTVCLSMLQSEVQDNHATTPRPVDPDDPLERPDPVPPYESHWMSAELLSLSADYIDTLLEDWYPGLGAREGGKTMDSVPYVNRIVPCPYCVSDAGLLEEEETPRNLHSPSGSPSPSPRTGSCSPSTAKKGFRLSKRPKKNRNSHSPSTSSLASSPSSKAKRALFPGSNDKSRGSAQEAGSPGPLPEDLPSPVQRSTRQGSLLELQGKMDLPVRETSLPETELTQKSKFGFMIENCIIAARQSQPLVCPAHQNHPLPIRDVAPDLVFADLPSKYMLNPACVDKGEYINHGSFGDIYHGAVYPSISATDDEGREVAIKIDRLDSKKFSVETATKSYIEVRAEVSLLHRLQHPHVIDFIGVVLQPLCFILEWAPGGSLDSVLHKYRKLDARISPKTLLKTAHQVASGLAYLHSHKIVYYDLKSPNILVFQFPSAQDSLMATRCSQAVKNTMSSVYVKIADLGISQILSPGGVMGFKGSPGFMAPEILKYVGTEACTEKVDIYSFAMFLFETISLYFPFEKQNLMHAQIEKLVIEGERPPLQSRELNNPILFLDVMRWCWQQDYTIRPSASQLEDILTNPSIPHLVDAISLHNSNAITCACVCTLPIEILPPGDGGESGEGSSVLASVSSHSYMAEGDLQEELWLSTFNGEQSEIVVINFKGKAAKSFPVCESKITSMCSVSYSLWLGTEDGEVIILDLISKHSLFRRRLTVRTDQSIVGLYHLVSIRRVVVVRKDGYIILCNEDIENHKSPDLSTFDNHEKSTMLPVRSVNRFPESLPAICSTVVPVTLSGCTKWSLWCGTHQEMIMSLDINQGYISNCQKLYCRSRYEVEKDDRVVSIVTSQSEGTPGVSKSTVWAYTQPGNVLYCWDPHREVVLNRIDMREYTVDPISFFSVMDTQLFFAVETGKVFQLQTQGSKVTSSLELRGHAESVYRIMSLGARTLPKHWLPSIIGRSNVIEYYKDLVDEKEVSKIASSIVGTQTRLLMTVGYGYRGVSDQLVEPLRNPRDSEENFVLLWYLDS